MKDGNYDFSHITLISFITKDQKTFQILFQELKTYHHPVAKKTTEDFINCITVNALPKTITLEEIKNETEKDMELVTLREGIKNNNYRQLNMDKHEKFGTELTINDGIILGNYRLLIPLTLRSKIITLAHQGHLGIVKAKQLLRSKSFWSGMGSDIEKGISNCLPCQAVARASTPPSIKFTELPKQRWEHTGADFYGPTPNGQKLLIILDYFSRYPIVEIMNTTTAGRVINCLSRLFAIHGFPNSMLTDNGPPWNSTDMKLSFKARGIKHKRIAPLWPRPNGLTERFTQNINKYIRTSITSKTNWKENLQLLLMNYRNTSHHTTGIAPSTLFFTT